MPESPRRVYLHIGAPKTGTTYLQMVLWRNRRQLAANGVLFPVESGRTHFHAALDLRGARFGGHQDPAVAGSWRRFARQVTDWHGDAVLSHELLAAATEEQVRRAVESMQPAEVHVIYTARDIARQIPAMWQESVKNGRTQSFGRYVKRLRGADVRGRAGAIFWRSQDPVSVLGRWSTGVPADRIHLVTLPPTGADPLLLWERFCRVLRLDAGSFDAEITRSNVSMGLAEAELVRRLNFRLRGRLPWPAYEAVVKQRLAEATLAKRNASARAALPPRQHRWAVVRAKEMVATLEGAGYDVVGDLQELVPSARKGKRAIDTRRPNKAAMIDAAVDVLAERLVAEGSAWAGSPRKRLRSSASRLRSRLRH